VYTSIKLLIEILLERNKGTVSENFTLYEKYFYLENARFYVIQLKIIP